MSPKASVWLIVALALTHGNYLKAKSTDNGTQKMDLIQNKNPEDELSAKLDVTDVEPKIEPIITNGSKVIRDQEAPKGIEEGTSNTNNREATPEGNASKEASRDEGTPEPDTEVENGEEDTIETDHGPVTAVNMHEGLGIKSYLDIPYGKFAKLFEGPLQPSKWEQPHHVIEHSKRCPQYQQPEDVVVGEIDCLTLSVFTPSSVVNAPVLFHIYDGDFLSGSADPTIYGPEHLVSKGIILVLPNYRLGPLGFLCLPGSNNVPGNAALKDLTLALDWTKRNIAAFGGDPSNIVVSGEGTAGVLVGYLTISPMSRHYITGAVTESGSVLSHLAIDRNPQVAAATLASRLVASNTRSIDIEIFDQMEDIESLLRAANNTKFKPCIDTGSNAFLNATPWSILRQMETNISFMIGTADLAGMHEALEHTETSINDLNGNFSLYLPSDLQFETYDDINYISDRLKRLYFGELDITIRDREKLAVWYTDTSYLGPSTRMARQLVEAGASVYFYEFSFIGAFNRERNALIQPLQGAARGDIVGYVFCQDSDLPHQGSDEELMIDIMTGFLATFIKTRKPSEHWNALKKAAASEEEWLSIGQQVSQQQGIHVQRLNTWTEVYDAHFMDIEHNLATTVQGTLVTVAVMLLTSLQGHLRE